MVRDHENTEAVRAFFDQWEVCKKLADFNYAYHREAIAAFERWLDLRKPPGAFLDLRLSRVTIRLLPVGAHVGLS